MATNRSITYIDIDLNSVDDYWRNLIVPDVQDFRALPSARSAFRAAYSVWHLHDWVWHERNPGLDTSDPAFRVYRAGLIDSCPELAWLSDVTDAGKHRGLGRQVEVAEAKPKLLRTASLPLLLNSHETLVYTMVFSDGSHENFAAVLERAVMFWMSELSNLVLPIP